MVKNALLLNLVEETISTAEVAQVNFDPFFRPAQILREINRQFWGSENCHFDHLAAEN